MRIEMRNTVKKQDGLGVGLLLGFLALFVLAYVLGSPSFADVFPLPMERALANLRTEINGLFAGLGKTFGRFI